MQRNSWDSLSTFLAHLRPPQKQVRDVPFHLWDPFREELRSKALECFESRRFRLFRRWLEERLPTWQSSPTANLLFGLSLIYDGEVHESEKLIDRARELWELLLDNDDISRADTAVLLVSAVNNLAFVRCAANDLERAELVLRTYLDQLCDDLELDEASRSEVAGDLGTNLLRVVAARRGANGIVNFLDEFRLSHPRLEGDEAFWDRVRADEELQPHFTSPDWTVASRRLPPALQVRLRLPIAPEEGRIPEQLSAELQF